MKREATLIKNTLIFAIGNFASKLLGFLLLPLYTGYLSAKDFGYFDLIVTTVTLFLPIISLQIYDGLYRYLLDTDDKSKIGSIISTTFSILLKNLLLFNVLYFIITYLLEIKNALLIVIYINVLVISQLYSQIARGLKKNIVYSISGFIGTCISLVASIISIAILNMNISGLLISLILSSIGTIIYVEYKLKIFSIITFNKKDKLLTKSLLVYSIPLIPNVVNWWIMNVSDRYLLSYFVNLNANGIYAVANKFPSILMIVNTIFNMAWQESAISEHKAKDKNQFYTKMFNVYLDLQWCAVLILISFTKPLMQIIVGKSFGEAWIYAPFLYFAVLFSSFSSFYGIGFQSSKETKGAFLSSICGSILNIILGVMLIPNIGIQGASVSTLVAFLAMWIIRIFQTKKYFSISIKLTKVAIYTILSLVFLFLYYQGNIYSDIIMIFSSLLLTIYFNKRLIQKLIKQSKSILNKLIVRKSRRAL